MHTASPGQTYLLNTDGIPTGQTVGFQVLNAATGLVAIARTEVGAVERPVGSGNYLLTFVAPAEGDLYLVVADWSGGVLTPETSKVLELNVTTEVQPGSSGLGAVADYVKMRLGAMTWKGLADSIDYGTPFIQRAISVVKRRVMTQPVSTLDESSLDELVLDYLGICVAIELVPAARDYWGSQYIAVTQGDDPTEVVTYPNRLKMIDDLRDDLMRKLVDARELAIPLIDQPVLRSSAGGPAIDEDDDCRVTDDPRDFPNSSDFPGGPLVADAYGIPRPSGVRL